MSGFNIRRAPADAVLPEDTLVSFISQSEIDESVEVIAEKQSENEAPVLYILPSAFTELNAHISWKVRTPENLSEQGGILVGNVYKDRDTQLVCGVVQHIIPSVKSGDATYIRFTHEDWIAMYKEFEEKYSSGSGTNALSVIGWYHTHPNMPVHMSGIDKQTHISFFPGINQFSVIINPQRGIWSVFNGGECENCNGFLYYSKDMEFDSADIGSDLPEETTSPITSGSFIIKRLPAPVSARRNSSFSDQYAGQQVYAQGNGRYINYGQLTGGREYRNSSQIYRGQRYYFPYHSVSSRMSYIISENMVRRLRGILGEWSFTGNESVSFSFFVEKSGRPIFCDSLHDFYALLDMVQLRVQGFVCRKSKGEFLSFRNTINPSFNDVMIVALFSETLPDFRTICEEYRDYDCLVWFNTKNTEEFVFFCIEKSISDSEIRPNFNIKNRPQTEINIGEDLVLVGIKIYERLLSTLFPGNGVYPYIYTVGGSGEKKIYRIDSRLLELVFKRIERYGKFTVPFSVVIGYSTLVEAGRSLVAPQLEKIEKLWFFLNNGQSVAAFHNLDDEQSAALCQKFAFIISNFDVNIDQIRPKLLGYTTAFCFNVETQNTVFFRLF